MGSASATSSESPLVASANGGPFFVFKMAGFALFAALGVGSLIDDERVVAGLVMIAVALAFVAFASRDARRVDLHADGTLIVRLYLRRAFATRAEHVTQISVDTSDLLHEWSITVDDNTFNLSSGRSTRDLVAELRRFRPSLGIRETHDNAGE